MLVAPFALALSLLTALLVFLLDICAFLFLRDPGGAGYHPLFHADPYCRTAH